MTVPTDPITLEQEKEFLLRSLDDLEAERAAGAIDDEWYTELHDDYTARAAAVIRALRDGIDARPAAARPPRRRQAVVFGVAVAFVVGSGVALVSALGDRLPGQTASGNSQGDASRVDALEQQVSAHPDSYALRRDLALALEADGQALGALKQWDAAIGIDATKAEAHANLARLIYLASEQVPDVTARAQLVIQARAGFDRALALDPSYADARYFRAVLLSNVGDLAGSQADLQRYLVLTPTGRWAEPARTLLGQVTKAMEQTTTTTVPRSP